MVDPAVRHRVVALAEGSVSEPVGFSVRREWTQLADVEDPAGDDRGPAGTYRYPLDPTWGAHRQLDIRRLRLFGSGGALRIELTMNEVTRSWNPANGFDHVAFTIFLELPGRSGGATVMPRQNARLPAGMQWHLRLRTGGWSNALFSSAGASAAEEGTRTAPAPGIEVDAATQRVILTLPAASLGGLKSLSGVKVYATTWDYDGGYRELAPEPRGSVFGGGSSARDPLVMDDVPVITLR
jgi:carbohydrate-binding DOMON domain-containing protein